VLIGFVAIIWCVVWLTCISESPEEDKRITKEELKYIVDSIGPTDNSKSKCVVFDSFFCAHHIMHITYILIHYIFFFIVSFLNYPWKDIFTSMPVWAITCAHFCENWGFYTLLTQLPSYMNGNHKTPTKIITR